MTGIEKYRQDAVSVHMDAYVGYPDVQESIQMTGDAGGITEFVVAQFAEVAA